MRFGTGDVLGFALVDYEACCGQVKFKLLKHSGHLQRRCADHADIIDKCHTFFADGEAGSFLYCCQMSISG